MHVYIQMCVQLWNNFRSMSSCKASTKLLVSHAALAAHNCTHTRPGAGTVGSTTWAAPVSQALFFGFGAQFPHLKELTIVTLSCVWIPQVLTPAGSTCSNSRTFLLVTCPPPVQPNNHWSALHHCNFVTLRTSCNLRWTFFTHHDYVLHISPAAGCDRCAPPLITE